MRQSPEEKYQHSISAGEMLPDPAQAQVMRRLTDLYQRIEQADNQDKGVAAKLTGWVAGLFSELLSKLFFNILQRLSICRFKLSFLLNTLPQ
jgi:predicted ATPase